MASAAAAPATTSSTSPALTPAQQSLASNANVPAGQAGSPWSTASTTPPPNFNQINSTNTNPTTPVTLPAPPPPNTMQASALVAGGTQTAQQIANSLQIAPGPEEQQSDSLLNQIATLTGQDSGKAQALLNAQQASGATADQSSLTALNNQLLTQTAQYNNEQANLGGNGSVETSAVLAAQNAGLTKARAADIGLTTAQIQAMQGNLTLAQNTATAAVNAQYSTIEDNIKTAQAQVAALAPLLSDEQKTAALAQQSYLTQQAQAVADQKAITTQINTVALQAAAAGATPDELAAINKSTNVISAIAAAAPALGAKAANDLQQQAFDNNIKLQTLMIQKATASITEAKDEAELKALQNESSPAAVIDYAQRYAATGVVPSDAPAGAAGAIAAVAQQLPKAPGTIYNTTTGVADSKLTADQETNISQLYNVVNNILPELTTNFAQNGGIGIGDPKATQTIQDYNDTVNSLKSVLATMNTAGILKGGTAQLESLIPSSNWGLNTSAGKRGIANLTTQITTQLNSYLSTNGLSIAGFNDTTDQTGVNAPSALSSFLTK